MPRKRAVNVCEFCHNHKIRCDVDSAGIPCSKCTEIGKGCVIQARKQYRNRKRARRSIGTSPNDDGGHVLANSPPPSSHPDPAEIVAAAILEPSSRVAPIFVGEGGYGAILDAMGETTNRHFHIPTTAEKTLTAEDLKYLKSKGCFTLPADSKELLKVYFKFVHPTFPVIDGSLFLQNYAVGGHEGINLLLLWSMFSVSASYSSISSRKARKEIYVHRAKLLFDLSPENDKIVLIQSALLLSFWFADTEDVKQSWYWTGIAFSIAQTLGLYREVRSAHTQVTTRQRSLWRNIWQCCMMRDVWLAFGMGRPLRIEARDSNSHMPEDADCHFTDMQWDGQKLYSVNEAARFASMWQNLIVTSRTLRDIITKGTISPSQAKSYKDQINVQDISNSTFLLTHFDRHLRLHQYAAIIALGHASGLKEDLEQAADNTTAIIQEFLHDNTTVYAAPVTIPLVIPAMVIYLATMRSRSQDARDSVNDKLNIYSQFFTAIEDNYPAASIVKRVFSVAQETVVRRSNRRDKEEVQPSFMN